MITLGHNLGLQVIAEGVETAEQLQNLQKQKCDIVQGYYFYKPLQTEEMNELLNTNQESVQSH